MLRVSLIAAAMSLFLLTAVSQATTVSGPFTTTTPIPSTATDWIGTLAFPKFNPSLGVLREVDLSLSSTMQTVLTVHNGDTGLPSSGRTNTHLTVMIDSLGLDIDNPALDISGPTYNYTLAPNQSLTSGALTKSKSSTNVFTDGSILAMFTGTGSILLGAETFTETALYNTGGNTDSQQITTAGLTGNVTYRYDAAPVPEPVTMVSAVLALGGLGAYVRRRVKIAKNG